MFTRKQYLDKECSHREYYSQLVSRETKNRVLRVIGLDVLLALEDEHLNDISLRTWDALGSAGWRDRWEVLGDSPSVAGYVCIHKEAARQIIDENA